MAGQNKSGRRADQVAFRDLRFAPLDVHPDAGTGDDIWVRLVLPVYVPRGSGSDSMYEAGLLEISCRDQACVVSLRDYAVRRVYRKLLFTARLAVIVSFAGLAFFIALFALANDGNPIRADGGNGIIFVWQFGPVAAFINLFVPALVVLVALLVARSLHRLELQETPIAVPEALMASLCLVLGAIRQYRIEEVPDHVRESRPGLLGARAGGEGGELVGVLINAGYDFREDRKRTKLSAEMRRSLAEALLGIVERFGATRLSVSKNQFRNGDS